MVARRARGATARSDRRKQADSSGLLAAFPKPPPGREVEIDSGTSCFVRDVGDPDSDRPTVLLLHGWVASGGLNWMRTFQHLTTRYRVLAPDFRGHARGARTNSGFSISECADDMAALVETLSPERPVIVAGYSMGGMVAQELWRRHPDCVGGLVLSATSAAPVPRSRGRASFRSVMAWARDGMNQLAGIPEAAGSAVRRGRTPTTPRTRQAVSSTDTTPTRSRARRGTSLDWAAREFRRHHWPTVLDAGRAIANFDARAWIGEIDVPTTVFLTKQDRLVPPAQQRLMAERIPKAKVESMNAGHLACVRDDFAPRVFRSLRGVERAMAGKR